jgi:peptidoglycan/LPS O-acetylase OafA/YrhL
MAALCVVFDHACYHVLLTVRSQVYQWFDCGQYGVFVFFLVSGYIIPASLDRKGSIRDFWIGRAFRLYPLYVLAIVASAVAYKAGLGTLAGAQRHPWSALTSWLVMIPNFLSGDNVPNVAWTLSYEMAFYLLVTALFSVRAHRHAGSYALACGVIVVTVGGLLPMGALNKGHGLLGPGAVGLAADALILGGIAMAVTGRAGRGAAGGSVIAGSWLAAITALTLLTVNQYWPFSWTGYTILAFMFTGTLAYRAEQGQVPKAAAAMIAAAVLAMTVTGGLLAGTHHPAWGTASASWRWQYVTSLAGAALTFGIGMAARNRRVPKCLAWLGMVSYSVYMMHPLVIDAYSDIPVLAQAGRPMWAQILLAAGLLAAILALAAVTYYLVEAPMQRIGRQVAARIGHRERDPAVPIVTGWRPLA